METVLKRLMVHVQRNKKDFTLRSMVENYLESILTYDNGAPKTGVLKNGLVSTLKNNTVKCMNLAFFIIE